MAKNKKIPKLDYTPSQYQNEIFDFVLNGVGNGVIKACAGSGKTKTIVTASKLVPKSKKCLFIAFNKAIVEELSEKLKSNTNCSVRTIHSLGYQMVRRNLGNDIEINEFKYRLFVKNNIAELTSVGEDVVMTDTEVNEYIENILKLIDFSRFNIAQTVQEIREVANRYSIPVSFDECEVALKCMQWGKENYQTIDYTDMVWLPYELSMRPMGLQFDWIMFDECQDASLMAIQLFLRCFKRGTRFIAVGDDAQCINMFAGSAPEAFQFMCDYPNTTVFNLPITYRCPKLITEFANQFAPAMMPREDAPDGKIIYDCSTYNIREGDMVLCRSRTPLLKLYVKLLRRNVNCYMKGHDIGNALIEMLNGVEGEELNSDLQKDGVFVKLYDKMFNERNKLMQKNGLDLNDATLTNTIMSMYDNINSLSVLAERCRTKSELIANIKNIYKDESNGVCLSTIHKAKGLEADNIFILCNSSMPSKLAKFDWEKQQEVNLQYVAYTRAKETLSFVSEKEIGPSGSLLEPTDIINELRYVEGVVCDRLDKEPMCDVNKVDVAKFKLKTATVITDVAPETNVSVIETNNKNEDTSDILLQLADFIKSDESNIEKLKEFLKG